MKLYLEQTNIEELINFPVHISNKTNLAAFIPFCSFGQGLIGLELDQFEGGVCGLFRDKVVSGQLCYEAELNQFKKDGDIWEEDLQRGFSFIIDTNEEYDVKNIMLELEKTTGRNVHIIFFTNEKILKQKRF